MKISNNSDFFKKPLTSPEPQQAAVATQPQGSEVNGSSPAETRKSAIPHTSGAITVLVKQTAETLTKCGLPKMATRVEKILNDVAKDSYYSSCYIYGLGISYKLKPVKQNVLNKIINKKFYKKQTIWIFCFWERIN